MSWRRKSSLIFMLGMLILVSALLTLFNSSHLTVQDTPLADGQNPLTGIGKRVASRGSKPVENRVLLLLQDGEKISSMAVALLFSRFRFANVTYSQGQLPRLVQDQDTGLYSVIVIENIHLYLGMEASDRRQLDSYCLEFSVAQVLFTSPAASPQLRTIAPMNSFPLQFSNDLNVASYEILQSSEIPDISRAGYTHNVRRFKNWTVFHPNHSTYETVSVGYVGGSSVPLSIVLLDKGLFDGIRRVFFGHVHHLWLHKSLFLDSLAYLTQNAIRLSKERLIQIDIDDVFLGSAGSKMKSSDVLALMHSQTKWRATYVPGLNFYLGFSGAFFKVGSAEDQEGDEKLIELREHFRWFDHMFRHTQAHTVANETILQQQMELSKAFAKEHNITVDPVYSVAPHHSGVYPIHEPLYTAWKNVWGIRVSSTEEYPHLRPQWLRNGFVHADIQILPRQLCGLFTKNLLYKDYPNGPINLELSIEGGDLYDTVLYNHVNIYMTHQQNYGHDRLALYTFEKLFALVNTSTALELRGAEPLVMAEKYFTLYPDSRQALWTNPCDDPRHMEIWREGKSCRALPSFLIVGPQKTGTTALYHFLKLHPNITASRQNVGTFEEVQFFGGKNYHKGLDWYLQFFEETDGITFEKSATYFDDPQVPRQASGLLPRARIVIVLIDPIDRAFSWYHHAKVHRDAAAINFTFNEIIKSESTDNTAIKALRSRLLRPGFYYEHIQRWRQYYPDSQLLYIDGENLKTNPAEELQKLQFFLPLQFHLDYKQILKFSQHKGFYCIDSQYSVGNAGHLCLGRSKGRSQEYGPVDEASRQYLQTIFEVPNRFLAHFLETMAYPLPKWLQKSLSDEAF